MPEIEAYLARHSSPHVEDASNQDTAYRRNYLRREILPRLEQLNPRLNQRLWESACQFRREDAYLTGRRLPYWHPSPGCRRGRFLCPAGR